MIQSYAHHPSSSLQEVKDQRLLAGLAYALNLLSMGLLTCVLAVVAVIINYLKRRDSVPYIASHHRWMIRTFWWTLAWMALGGVTTFIGIGFIVIFFATLWWLYRQVRGLIHLYEERPMPV